MPPRMNQYCRARFPLRYCGRLQRLALVWRKGPRASNLSDYARLYSAAVRALLDVADNLLRQVLHAPFIHVIGMDRVHVEARAHDDMHTRFAGDSGQRIRVASDADSGSFHDRATARLSVHPDFFNRCSRVHQLQVEVVAVVVASDPPQILQRYGSVRQILGRRVLRGTVHSREVKVEVLVGGGGTKPRR